jgi:hypothetical protein
MASISSVRTLCRSPRGFANGVFDQSAGGYSRRGTYVTIKQLAQKDDNLPGIGIADESRSALKMVILGHLRTARRVEGRVYRTLFPLSSNLPNIRCVRVEFAGQNFRRHVSFAFRGSEFSRRSVRISPSDPDAWRGLRSSRSRS